MMEDKDMIIAGTGHRPPKLGGYSDEARWELELFAKEHLESIKPKPEQVVSGMALGWDQALATASIYLGIPTVAAIPCVGFHDRWPAPSRERYLKLREMCEVHIITDRRYEGAWMMQKRNEWMVDHCDHILALWDGSSGGTANCIRYAKKKDKPITNLWSKWKEMPND